MDEAILALLKGMFSDLETRISEGVQRQLATHKEEISASIESNSSSFLDTLLEEAEGFESGDDDFEDDFDDDLGDDFDDDLGDGAVTRSNPEVVALKRQLDALTRQSLEDRTAREQAETQRKREALVNNTIEALGKTNKVVNPRQLLKLLEADGVVTATDDGFVIVGRDQYGEVKIPVAEKLDDLLSGDYAHFAFARPGTGTGASHAGSSSSGRGGMKYFDAEGKPKMPPAQALAQDREGYLAELNEIAQ